VSEWVSEWSVILQPEGSTHLSEWSVILQPEGSTHWIGDKVDPTDMKF